MTAEQTKQLRSLLSIAIFVVIFFIMSFFVNFIMAVLIALAVTYLLCLPERIYRTKEVQLQQSEATPTELPIWLVLGCKLLSKLPPIEIQPITLKSFVIGFRQFYLWIRKCMLLAFLFYVIFVLPIVLASTIFPELKPVLNVFSLVFVLYFIFVVYMFFSPQLYAIVKEWLPFIANPRTPAASNETEGGTSKVVSEIIDGATDDNTLNIDSSIDL